MAVRKGIRRKRPFVPECMPLIPDLWREAQTRCSMSSQKIYRDTSMNSRQQGFTLVELMAAVAIMATLMMIALPNFRQLMEDNQVVTQVNDFRTAIASTRSEAIRRGIPVTLTAGTTGEGGSYTEGWCIHTGASCENANILSQHLELKRITIDEDTDSLQFDRLGRLASPVSAEISFQPESCTDDQVRLRKISVISSGRVSVNRENCI